MELTTKKVLLLLFTNSCLKEHETDLVIDLNTNFSKLKTDS